MGMIKRLIYKSFKVAEFKILEFQLFLPGDLNGDWFHLSLRQKSGDHRGFTFSSAFLCLIGLDINFYDSRHVGHLIGQHDEAEDYDE
jgi:hypothetical protein